MLYFAFAFAWPHALVVNKASLLAGVRLAKGRYWRIAAGLVLVIVLTGVLSVMAPYVSWFITTQAGFARDAPADPLLNPSWLTEVAVSDGLRIFGAYLLATASAYLYARLTPRPDRLADAFA